MIYDIVSLPDWAIGYIENADATGLTDSEQAEIEKFLAKLPPNSVFSYSEGTHFSPRPAFGLACTCYDATISYCPKRVF